MRALHGGPTGAAPENRIPLPAVGFGPGDLDRSAIAIGCISLL